MIGYGISTQEWHEPSLTTTVPVCVPFLAASHVFGWRLVPPPETNYEDILTGCNRLQLFKDAKARQLRRIIRIHYVACSIALIDGQAPIRLDEFRALYDADALFRAHCTRQPHYDAWLALAHKRTASAHRAVLAIEHNRSAYGRIHGDKTTLVAMARFFEDGV